jgi:hypothetical protein
VLSERYGDKKVLNSNYKGRVEDSSGVLSLGGEGTTKTKTENGRDAKASLRGK